MMNLYQEYAQIISTENCCIQSQSGKWNLPLGDCYFGVPQNDSFGWAPLTEIPLDTKGFHFYLGSDGEKLVEKFTNSAFIGQVERLSIGNSSYDLGSGLDYRNIVTVLSKVEFPNLKRLQLGVSELFSNSHCSYGSIGNLTELLQKMPKLEELNLFGAFKLDHPLELPMLKKLSVMLEDYMTGSNGGAIDQATFSHLLESSFPMLNEAYLDLECEENKDNYLIPDLLVAGTSWPNLQEIEYSGLFAQEEQEKLRASPFVSKNSIKIIFEESE